MDWTPSTEMNPDESKLCSRGRMACDTSGQSKSPDWSPWVTSPTSCFFQEGVRVAGQLSCFSIPVCYLFYNRLEENIHAFKNNFVLTWSFPTALGLDSHLWTQLCLWGAGSVKMTGCLGLKHGTFWRSRHAMQIGPYLEILGLVASQLSNPIILW